MSEEILESMEDAATNQVAVKSEKITFQNFFKNKLNIFGFVCAVVSLIVVVLYILLPVVYIGLTPEGVSKAQTVTAMASYKEILTGIQVLFGGADYTVWHNLGSSEELITQTTLFNPIVLVGLIATLAGGVLSLITVFTRRYGVLNKIALSCSIGGLILLLLTPVWFYAINPITASTRYDTTKAGYYEWGYINAHGYTLVTLIELALGVVASAFAGLLIPKPVDAR